MQRILNRLYTFFGYGTRLMGLLACLCIIATKKAQGASYTGPDSSCHIYLLMGQSNMAGRGYLTEENKAIHNDKVLVLNKDMDWVVAHNPLHYEKPNDDGVGPGLAFGIQMLTDANDPSITIGLVPCAVGGSPIEHWKVGAYDEATSTHPYDDAVVRIKEAMKKGIISGVIWHQGESDCTDELAPLYMPQLYDLIANIRSVTGNAHLPFVVGELGAFFSNHDKINVQLPALTEHLSDVAVVSSVGLTQRGDALHFDATSAETLGRRYAAKMEEVQNFEPAGIGVDAATGKYTITSNITGWSFSGTVGSPLSNVTNTSGDDEAGSFSMTSFTWDNGNKAGSIRWYKNSPVVIFDIKLPNGLTGVLSSFPSFNTMPVGIHPFSYHDDHFSWPQFQLNETSTPWLFFDDQNRACIISPASHFMVAKMKGDGTSSIASTLNEAITSYPPRFSYSTIMVMDKGIRDSWDRWGTALRALYHRAYPDKDQDPLLKYYGYWTDNGADYYYNYDTNIGYEQTLLNLKQYYADNGIPMGYMQLDSWWYEKSNFSATGVEGPGYKNSKLPRGPWNLYGGLMDYTADPFIFPDGLDGFQQKLGVPLATHNRWIDPRSLYNQKYNISGIMSPDPAFWKDIMDYIHAAGVTCYEQDWLDYIYRGSEEMQNTLTVADQFTDEMASAAAVDNINLQYCMAMPRFFLQGLKYNNLTTIRTSDDRFKTNKWFNFLFTSQLAYETGAMPWSDVFKSTEMGNMVFSVLSSGPVGTGDGLGKENKANILMACRADAEIVRPDVPMLPLDQSYQSMAAGDGKPVLGYTYTYTPTGNITTDYLYAFCDENHTVRDFSFKPDEIGMSGTVAIYNPIAKTLKVQAATTTFSDQVSSDDFNYYIMAPVTSSGIAFLGDGGKIAATGRKRIIAIQPMGKELQVTVQFAAGERAVTLQGYCGEYVRADKGDVQMDAATHVFSVNLDKPTNSDQATIVFTPTDAVAIMPGVFATTWKTDNAGGTPMNIEFKATGSNFSIHWADMFDATSTGESTGISGDNSVIFPKAGTYLVSISPGLGSFTGFQIGTASPKKLLSVEQWGMIEWTDFASAYSGATNLMLNAVDTPHLALIKDMSGVFKNCSGITTNPAMNNWHTGDVTNMADLFNGATAFDQAIGKWDVSNVTTMSNTFKGCKAFNQTLDDWSTAKVTNMSNMFNGALAFDQPIGNWDVSQVNNIGHVLQSARSFDQDLRKWDVSGVTNMAFMFYDARRFNADISGWNTAKVVNMVSLLSGAAAFNQNLGKWDLSSVTVAKNNDGSLVSMLSNSGMDCSNYSLTLKEWSERSTTPSGLTLGVTNLSYDEAYAQASRDALADNKNWVITGDIQGHCTVTAVTLPVRMTSFSGDIKQGTANLKWQSGVETGFDHYELEALYAAMGQNPKGSFSLVGRLPAAGSGNTYRLSTTQQAHTGYYRLKMVDRDGRFNYVRNIVTLNRKSSVVILRLYPNPAASNIYIQLGSGLSKSTLHIYTADGKLVRTSIVGQGVNSVDLRGLSSGVYFAEVNSEKLKFVKK